MNQDSKTQDPMEFLKSMWGGMGFSLPGMVTPTLDADELAKRIADLKAVEGWLKTNLSMLQLTIQGLEVQCATISAIQAFSQSVHKTGASDEEEGTAAANPFLNAAMNPALWPWNIIQPTTDEAGTPANKPDPATPSSKPSEPESRPAKKRKS